MVVQENVAQSKIQYDSPWKNALEHFLPSFMEFCLPKAAAEIDWSRAYVSLDKELNTIIRNQAVGKRVVDKLFKVWLKNGKEVWLLLHIEVQNQKEANFSERMYIYNYRLFDRYQQSIISIAILGDEDPAWRPDQYERISCYNKVYFQFACIKLLDYYLPELLIAQTVNPFAVVIWAHLEALKTKRQPAQRLQSKMAITRILYECGFNKDYIVKLYYFIDWVMVLPAPLEIEYIQHIEQLEEKKLMPYISSVERVLTNRARQEGRQEGEATIILRLINRRFGAMPDLYVQQITEADAETLLMWGDRILDAKTIEDIFK